MCGFIGYIANNGGDEKILGAMMDTIAHRGPDDDGMYTDEHIGLGFRRLSIIGLSDESPPIFNEDRSLMLVYNGELYNYQELKQALIEKGHVFYTNTDSEVVVHAYEEYKEKMLDHFRGMFAFAIWDKQHQTLFMARDCFGIKPLYYSKTDESFVFGSEIKSFFQYPGIKKELNEDALESYLSFQYSVLPETFFKGIFRLPPAHYLTYHAGELTIERYWQPTFNPNGDMTMEEAIDQIDDIMADSIVAHKISDTEVGSFLSSGVDSSYIATCSGVSKTFTVGFDYEQYNEIGFAEELSKHIGVQNHSKLITTDEYWNELPRIQYHMDEPLADPSAIALYFVSQLASKHVKVVLSGEGADELFGGYNIYREPSSLAPMMRLPKFLRKALAALASLIPFNIKGKNYLIRAAQPLEERFIGNAYMFRVKERCRLLKNSTGRPAPHELTAPYYAQTKGLDDVTRMQYIDLNFWLWGDILLKADRMSMAHSLEVRVPFLDKEVARVAFTIPHHLRVTKENTKTCMRKAARRHLPEQTANKKKLGFPVPIRVWLRTPEYYAVVKKAFDSEAAARFFSQDELHKLLDRHYANKADNSRKIWTIYIFLVWYAQFFGDA
ncbi:MAG: asparagine synthase (glutamine-hydrolyzing) [Christensenellales bacterium]|jgi:asparagine synthase (glutamine-hydrolysing)